MVRMDKQVEKAVRTCHPCQLVGPRSKPEPVRSTRLLDCPWQEISVDLLEITSGDHLLVVVDYYSRLIEAVLLKTTDAQHVIKSMEAIFRTHGLPETVRSDNGPPFTSKEFEGFLEYLAIEHKKGVPYWPQSNGEVERCNETLLKIVRITKITRRLSIPVQRYQGFVCKRFLPSPPPPHLSSFWLSHHFSGKTPKIPFL